MPTTKTLMATDTDAVTQQLTWFEAGCPNDLTTHLTELPANQLMELILFEQDDEPVTLADALAAFDPDNPDNPTGCLVSDAYKNRDAIAALMEAIKADEPTGDAYLRAHGYFDPDFSLADRIDVFYLTTGWEYGDAMQLRYSYDDGHYSIDEDGRLAVLINLTLVQKLYGKTAEEQYAALCDVLSHELFHALLDEYRKTGWKEQPDLDTFEGYLPYIMINEGIAHYIADRDSLYEHYISDPEYRKHEQNAFMELQANAVKLYDPSLPDDEKRRILNQGLCGDFWGKYICISGMFMAMHIEHELGMMGLRQCVTGGPGEFISTYNALAADQQNILALPECLVGGWKVKDSPTE